MDNEIITLDRLGSEIEKIISQEGEAVKNTILQNIGKIAKEIKTDLSNNTKIPKKSGKYRKSFYVTKENGRTIVANRKYQLTHLLEHGHELVKQGGRARAYPHWATAEKSALEKVDKMLTEVARNDK